MVSGFFLALWSLWEPWRRTGPRLGRAPATTAPSNMDGDHVSFLSCTCGFFSTGSASPQEQACVSRKQCGWSAGYPNVHLCCTESASSLGLFVGIGVYPCSWACLRRNFPGQPLNVSAHAVLSGNPEYCIWTCLHMLSHLAKLSHPDFRVCAAHVLAVDLHQLL